MKANPQDIGRVVISTCGHDKGRRFLIVSEVDDRYVLIADGDTRKLAHPKKKQRKHLQAEPMIATDALEAIRTQPQTADSTLRKALKALTLQQTPGSSRADRITSKEEYALVQE